MAEGGIESVGASRRGGPLARRLWGAAGLVSFGLGAAGAVLPVLPTTPFILLAAFCFARSSERLDAWFRSTRLYDLVFSSYLERRSMTVRAKLALLAPVTVLLAIGFFLTASLPALRIVIAAVWLGHLIYFGFVVKTEPARRS
ncbi:MAG: YbaN family protein [Collinsella sp.]|nr:YbaN family protein [Collinsella sp.]